MNESERLADQMKRALDGGAWHGPSWKEALDGLTLEQAMERPVSKAHTIAEIVLHSLTWHQVVRGRLRGETSRQLSPAEDWPEAAVIDDAAWSELLARFFQTGHALRATIAAFPPERLGERRPGLDDDWYGLIAGQLQHMLYHAGQIPILRKALSPREVLSA